MEVSHSAIVHLNIIVDDALSRLDELERNAAERPMLKEAIGTFKGVILEVKKDICGAENDYTNNMIDEGVIFDFLETDLKVLDRPTKHFILNMSSYLLGHEVPSEIRILVHEVQKSFGQEFGFVIIPSIEFYFLDPFEKIRELGFENNLGLKDESFAILFMQWSSVANCYLWPLLVHEVCHSVGGTSHILQEAQDDFSILFENPSVSYWCEETLADLLSTRLLGPAYVWAMVTHLLVVEDNLTGRHPAPSDRIGLCVKELVRMGFSDEAVSIRRFWDEKASVWKRSTPNRMLNEQFKKFKSRLLTLVIESSREMVPNIQLDMDVVKRVASSFEKEEIMPSDPATVLNALWKCGRLTKSSPIARNVDLVRSSMKGDILRRTY